MIVDYKVLLANNPDTLKELVEHWMAEDWDLQGGVSISFAPIYNPTLQDYDHIAYYAQAMVFDDPDL